jgi:hypothetical protein
MTNGNYDTASWREGIEGRETNLFTLSSILSPRGRGSLFWGRSQFWAASNILFISAEEWEGINGRKSPS